LGDAAQVGHAGDVNRMYESARDTSDSDLRALVDTALGRFSRIDAVVNNTGHAPANCSTFRTTTGERGSICSI